MGRLFFIPILTLIINIYPLLFRILKSSFICTCWKDSLLPCGVLLFPFASFCYWRTFSLCCWWCSSSTATKNFYQRHLYTLFLLLLAFTGYVYFCFFWCFEVYGSSGSSIPAKLVGFKACWLIWTTSSAPFNSWLIPRKEQSSTEHVSSSYRSSWNLCEPSSSSFISFIYSWTECTLITKQPFKYFFLLKLKKKKKF